MGILDSINSQELKNLTLLNQTEMAREYFWSSVINSKNFDDIYIKIYNVVCEKCEKIISEHQTCDCVKNEVILTAGRGRKPCKNCPAFSGPRTKICDNCGYNFKSGIIEKDYKRKEISSKLSQNKKLKKAIIVPFSKINNIKILIDNDKIEENILLFKDHPNLSEDQRSTVDSYCIWREEFLLLNQPLADGIANIIYHELLRKDSIKHLKIEDLRQEAWFGLKKAFTHFDRNRTHNKTNTGESKNVSFSTYATFWIRKSIKDAVLDTDKDIFVPVYIINYYKKFTKFYNSYINRFLTEPSVEEIMEELKVAEGIAIGLLFLRDLRQKKMISVEETTDKYRSDIGDDAKISKNDINLMSKLSYEEEYHFDYKKYLEEVDFIKPEYRNLFIDLHGLNEERLEYPVEKLIKKYNVTAQTISNIDKNTLSQLREIIEND